ncbi:hypothetical protein E3N88_33033 [Mikania micrantha]|uniref:Uncharacterized protein n=1 Tax=Mikania micrantha TaxID=192012 RepID=A0A5N6MAU1_9ASTR|nr:hypothetical protein E3N88_33033 [Mikania micrantha]
MDSSPLLFLRQGFRPNPSFSGENSDRFQLAPSFSGEDSCPTPSNAGGVASMAESDVTQRQLNEDEIDGILLEKLDLEDLIGVRRRKKMKLMMELEQTAGDFDQTHNIKFDTMHKNQMIKENLGHIRVSSSYLVGAWIHTYTNDWSMKHL